MHSKLDTHLLQMVVHTAWLPVVCQLVIDLDYMGITNEEYVSGGLLFDVAIEVLCSGFP